ncbi:DUF4258 domain-containing protein [Micrococcales bacterium 31B]|nr:DUF4258 domain-containing protein [Micrococcales bacterium 31B]
MENALSTQPDVRIDTANIPEGQVVVHAGKVTAPAANSAQQFSIALDELSPAAVGVSAVAVDDGDGVALTDEGDGAFRTLFYVADAKSPTEYRFEVDAAFELIALEDGGITVRTKDGQLAGTIAPPWAVDRHGHEVPTSYTIVGNTVIQRVFTSTSTAFPVVADPFWIPALMVLGHLTRHAITQAAARGVSQAMIKQVLQNGVRSAGHKGTSVFTQGKGANRIRVVVDNKTGNVITVTKG